MLVNRCNGSINKILRRTTTRIPQLYLSEKHSCVLVVPLVLARRVDRQRWQRQPIAKNCPDGTLDDGHDQPPSRKDQSTPVPMARHASQTCSYWGTGSV